MLEVSYESNYFTVRLTASKERDQPPEYSFSYSGDFLKPNIIRIRNRVIFQTEYYLYSYSGDCLKLKATGIFFWIL